MSRYRIHAPVPDHSGVVAGVGFHTGVGEVDDPGRGALSYFAGAGYRIQRLAGDVDEGQGEPPEDDGTVPPPLPSRGASKAVWVAHALSAGVDPAEIDAMTRDQLAERFHGAGGQG